MSDLVLPAVSYLLLPSKTLSQEVPCISRSCREHLPLILSRYFRKAKHLNKILYLYQVSELTDIFLHKSLNLTVVE